MNQNRKTVWILTGLAIAMLSLGFASKPLYEKFCSLTGYGGTPKRAAVNNNEIIDRTVRVYFDSNIAPGLPWEFKPEQRFVDVKLGQSALAYYRVKNISDEPIVGTANFNVTPIKGAPFFVKTECFCFTEQLLEAGQEVTMPVLFFVDPLLDEEERYKDVKDMTLSYTFFRVKDPKTVSAAQGRDALN